MKRLIALILVLVGFSVSAQTPQTTNNLINPANYTGQSRTGAINGANPRDSLGCCTGSGAYVDTSGGGATYFSYSSTTVGQTIAINQALQGSGVQVGGYNYSWSYYNQDYNRGSLTSTIRLTSNTGSTLQTYSPTMGATTNGWTALSGTQTFANPYSLSSLGNLSVSFTGRDDRFWAGYYGPAVKNVNLSLNYTVDPCVGNPRYSTSCAGYNNSDMWSTGDLTSVYGTTFAINTALGFGNTGVRVHSVNWGYDYNIGGRYCSGWNLFGICFGWSNSYVDGSLSGRTVPGDDITKEFYKRLYHNLPYLLKTRGTMRGLRALINCFGVPDTILRINEFGGESTLTENSWNNFIDQFNYEFFTTSSGYVNVPIVVSTGGGLYGTAIYGGDYYEGDTSSGGGLYGTAIYGGDYYGGDSFNLTTSSFTIEFRFKTTGIPTNPSAYNQILAYAPENNLIIVLEYTGSGYTSGSYSGSIPDPYNEYGTLKLITSSSGASSSLYLPFFDGGWWSVMYDLGN